MTSLPPHLDPWFKEQEQLAEERRRLQAERAESAARKRAERDEKKGKRPVSFLSILAGMFSPRSFWMQVRPETDGGKRRCKRQRGTRAWKKRHGIGASR